MNGLQSALNKAGYYVGNNITDLPGVRMYAGSPGMMTVQEPLVDIIVSDTIKLVKSRYANGKFLGLELREEFRTAEKFLQWCAVYGTPNLPGLPAFCNSWD